MVLDDNNDGTHSKKKIVRTKWTEQQKSIMKKYFEAHIENKKPPKKEEAEKLIKMHKGVFENKNWVKIKAYIFNCYRK